MSDITWTIEQVVGGGAVLEVDDGRGEPEEFMLPSRDTRAPDVRGVLDRAIDAYPDLAPHRAAILAGVQGDFVAVDLEWIGERLQVTVRSGDSIQFADRLDPASARRRKMVVAAVVDTAPSVDPDALERRLLAAMIERGAVVAAPAPQGDGDVPWPDPVDGSELLAELEQTIERFVILRRGVAGDDFATASEDFPCAAIALALWVVHSYCFDVFSVTPRLAIVSPTHRCGKSTLLDVLAGLVKRSVRVSNASTAAVFRAIDAWAPTLLIDEADTFLVGRDADPEMRGVLNDGFRADGAVLRCVGDDHEPQEFACVAPVAIALIQGPGGGLATTLADRSIFIEMRRKLESDEVERYTIGTLRTRFADLRGRCLRWAADHRDRLASRALELEPIGLGSDRAEDCWSSLSAIAELSGATCRDRARIAARELTRTAVANDDAGDLGRTLLSDVRDILDELVKLEVNHIRSADLAAKLAKLEDRPWSEWRRGEPITATAVARQLRPYGIRPKPMLGGTTRGYVREAFAEAWQRYLEGPSGEQGVKPSSDGT